MSTEMGIPRALGLTVQDVAKLGAFGVVRESLKLFGGARPAFVWIQFALVLPFTIVLNIDQMFQQAIISDLIPKAPPAPSPPIVKMHGNALDLGLDKFLNLDLHQWLWLGLFTLLVFVSFCLGLILTAAIYYAVGAIYNGKNVTFCECMRAVPGLWKRLFVTSVVNFLMVLSSLVVLFVFIVIFVVFIPQSKHTLRLILVNVFLFLFLIPIFVIYLMFQVANGVTCFEEGYGVAAFRKGKHLMHGKWWSAVLLFIILAIPSLIIGALVASPIAHAKGFSWTLVVLVVVYIILSSYLTQLACICWAVYYFSCAANYDQQALIHDQMEAAYEPIAPEPRYACVYPLD